MEAKPCAALQRKKKTGKRKKKTRIGESNGKGQEKRKEEKREEGRIANYLKFLLFPSPFFK